MGEFGTDGSVGPWSATLVRMLFGGIGATVLFVLFLAGWFADKSPAHEPESRSRLSGGGSSPASDRCNLRPVLGVWLGLVSIERIDAGVAATLMSLSPIFILPVARFVEHEHIGMRAVFGAVLAVIGVAVLVMSTGSSSPVDQDEVTIRSESVSPGWTSTGGSPHLNTLASAPDSSTSSS